jgi:2-methylcitrate dehydratase PrpD
VTSSISGTQKVAQFIAETEYEHLPPDAILAAKHGILDWLGVALLGAGEPSVKILSDYARGLAGRQEATALRLGFRTAAELAALVNGASGHALDFDDTIANSVRYNLHPTTCILPAAMAMAETLKLSGRDLLLSYIVGLETEFRIGAAIGQLIPAIGWYPTPVLGTLGATAAGAKALRLSPAQGQSALGIASSLAGGMKKNVGTMTKTMHAGNGARNGVVAATLAHHGFTGDLAIFEGENGFCGQFSNRRITSLLNADEALGREWMFISAGLAFKPYPCCRATHPSIDAVLFLRERYGIQADQISSITCKLNPLVLGMTPYERPQSGYEAKFSMKYAIARALLDGEVRLDHFTDEKMREEDWKSIIPKINFIHPDAWGHGAVDLLTEIVIHLTGGQTISHRVAIPKGEPENPMTEGELVEKFKQCTKDVFKEEERQRWIDLILHLERAEDLSEFWEGLSQTRD